MALGDEIEVLYDAGGSKPASEVVKATTAGGSVKQTEDEFNAVVRVSELSRSGRPVRAVIVPLARLVAVIERPRR